jgi:hypothetical protein
MLLSLTAPHLQNRHHPSWRGGLQTLATDGECAQDKVIIACEVANREIVGEVEGAIPEYLCSIN